MSHKASHYSKRDHESVRKALVAARDNDLSFCVRTDSRYNFWSSLAKIANAHELFRSSFVSEMMPTPYITATRNRDKWNQVILHLNEMVETDSDVNFKYDKKEAMRISGGIMNFAMWSEVPFPDLGHGPNSNKWCRLYDFFHTLARDDDPYDL